MLHRVGVVLAMVILVACSTGDAAPAATQSSTPTTLPTEATSTTPSSTAATTTTSTSPTTEVEDRAAAVEADLLEAFRLGDEALQDPSDEQAEAAALDRRLGFIAERFAQTLAEYRTKNYAIRPNVDVPESVTVELPPTFLGADGEVAEVQICEINSWILVEVGAGPNGTDAVVNPDVIATRAMIFMRLIDGTWRFEGSNLIQEWFGADECATV
jgi:hypothetical protein